MLEKTQKLLTELKNTFFDEPQLTVFDVTPEFVSEKEMKLTGKVLEEKDKTLLATAFSEKLPGILLDMDNLQVLQNENTPILRVNKNLSSMHREKSFHTELMTQMFYGDPIAVLMDEGDWVLGRNMLDGYISYTYKKYLSENPWQEPTHIVTAPVTPLYKSADKQEQIGRVLGGTRTLILEEKDGMVRIPVDYEGWVEQNALTASADLPTDRESLRNLVCSHALKLIGVPYLWGGSSANGIDCSGLVQLAYRLSGIPVLRDAHMQYIAEQSVQPPFLPGDVVLYGQGVEDITHASISLGGWTVIHSSRSRNGVYIDDALTAPALKGTFVAAIRYI